MIEFNVNSSKGFSTEATIDKKPDECPLCKSRIDAKFIYGYMDGEYRSKKLKIVYQCPYQNCKDFFVGYYYQPYAVPSRNEVYFLEAVSRAKPQEPEVSEIISGISSAFEKAYKQSSVANDLGLSEVSGPGFRRSLELLVKDYSIRKHPDKKEHILKQSLALCISEYIENPKIKDVSKRAAWLGNDEAHYARKWEGKDINDLIKLISMTNHWIELEEESSAIIADMPDEENKA
jgi:hypothetical protein